jgi:hypothetical protein
MAHFPTRTTVKHQLSSYKPEEGGWVELYTDPDVAEVEQVFSDENASNFTKGLIMLTAMIQSWGFDEADGTPSAITIDNVRKLGMTNINELLELVNLPGSKEPLSPKASDS